MSEPTVSIVTALYNGANLVGETIDSVQRQSFTDWEMVIVDDCSTDDARAVLAKVADPRVRVIHAEVNRGPVHARNRAIAAARGRYIAALDHDDLCRPDRLAKQVAFLDANPEVVLVASDAELLEDGRVKPSVQPPVTSPDLIDWHLSIRNILVWSSVMVRADAARRLDPVTRPEALGAEDFDFYHRIRAHGRIARIDEALILYRCHAGGLSKRMRATMIAASIAVLTQAHAARFGDRAHEVAALLVDHIMLREPVADGAVLARLATALGTIRGAFPAKRDDPALAAAIDAALADQWRAVCRAGLRSGRLSLRDLSIARRAGIGGLAVTPDLIASRAVGAIRAARRR